ncbi:MAG: sigma-70 family RNA polymerase sigma factor [Tannerellaceae bacterium]|jgi:RNA polymerase sigma-70 factor (ECF subfamily)|nr:sigma-70 family RNA polymerase sigma factor [Tannerellaceae bacterium]
MELYCDTYYVRRVQDGDVASFACLLDRYSRPVYSLVFKLTRNREDAEELTQDVFMKVFRKLGTFKGESSFSTWIYRIAYNTAISETRRRKMEFLSFEETLIENLPEEKTAGFLEGELDAKAVHLDAALAKLPPEDEAIILFFYMEDKSIEDIAVITGLSLSNVKTRLHRIRKKLFVLLTQMEEQENG